ncbi:MAG: hypothetical protein A3C85_01240 [Candidatus Doudnabacteria bacterium RIFCSPHIGHO2_02_FULL_48_21]|uniref:AB hydrolase-1 domain-containing protein n=1 Tax=Candidatus Doudnabacteria bacterium RIFCSPLOWO2_02_FULL_48_13 TaxID=1817845 RepID=A0A1F5Q985_9BACT|nr:MAG: hypothetical protein A3K05_04285 [Candidatus Doudnabacteria bacterium RIFCSPHIGHO2_01_48_18]OGE79609.1 MAG: hypothetical protein A2668_03295 [Candidatus Doudnabacteria bacterium RIFCSPHIGHO2_01_FULL_48_180]OGE91150.1 MAG: hypothetical protein A3F44_02180 [Candidatus Doudnabacteria bacterium RIFCSPHIGHO2_12_FULL_47_25]OGE93827.1 MAG: hypothetical protein A3C85_01240 [Candidatus Doudnabacteria bacterium RIFCSPHIGHO2_02_FULL_48_21]OGE98012.1 MAG: hypothetical protein A3A83_00825 [Candidatu
MNYLSNEVVDPAAQTVVFLHGWRSEAAVWRPVMDRLGRRYRQFALDLPGFGKSEKPKHIFTLVDYATVVLGFIKKMELKKIVVVGHSFGGRVVIKLSALEPDIVEKLILVDSAGFRLHGKRNAVLRIVAKMLKPFFMIPGLRTLRLPIYRVMGAEDYLATPELRETFLNVINEDLTALLGYVRQETLIVWGGRDEDTPLMLAMWLKEHIPHSDLVIFHNAGHFSFLDEPDKFVGTVRDFLKA